MGVYANSRSIIHSGDGGAHTAAPPDVCKTPLPAGPVPIPYVNIASSSDSAKGTKHVKIEGNPTANEGSELSTSSGDEPGTAGGVVSSKFKGKMTWASTSSDVKSEGKGVARFMDPTLQNSNTCNTAFISVGGTGVAYGDDFQGACSICEQGPAAHRVLETPESKDNVRQLRQALMARLQPHMVGLRTYRDRETTYNMYRTRLADLTEARNRLVAPTADELAALDAQIATVTADIDVAKAAWKAAKGAAKNNVLKRETGGYMIGCMVCRSDATRFGAMSGDNATPGFAGAVGDVGWTLCDASVSEADFPTMNPQMTPDDAADLTVAWNTCKDNGADAARRAQGESWNKPGVCAAYKLIGRSKPHQPRTMTEEWFDPVKEGSVNLTYPNLDNTLRSLWRQVLAFCYGDIRFNRVPGTFEDTETVPSCNTCQTLIPLLSCDNQKECG